MQEVFIILLVLLTSAIAYRIVRWHTGSRPSISTAAQALFEWLGFFALFFALNLFIGACIIVLFRNLTPRFVALYDLENILLLVLSAAEGFVFQRLWKWD